MNIVRVFAGIAAVPVLAADPEPELVEQGNAANQPLARQFQYEQGPIRGRLGDLTQPIDGHGQRIGPGQGGEEARHVVFTDPEGVVRRIVEPGRPKDKSLRPDLGHLPNSSRI